MNYAYSELYLEDAIRNMGEMVEYVDECDDISVDDFFKFFILSGYAERWEKGDPCVIAGMSGTELHHQVMRKCGIDKDDWAPALIRYDAGSSYWSGYILAYYQWKYNVPFSSIFHTTDYSYFIDLYPAMHTVSEEICIDTINKQLREKQRQTRLQAYRKRLGLSQKELSELTGVNLRTLQQYEVRDKDINKASMEKVISLADALYCNPKDLLEK